MKYTKTIWDTQHLVSAIWYSNQIRNTDRVKECFEKDLNTAISECELLYEEGVFGKLPDEVQQILVNMMFNMGRTRLSKFKKMHAGILNGDWKEAAKEGRDSKWYHQVTNRAERLMERLENV